MADDSSSLWSRVRTLRPSRAGNVVFAEREVRGQPWLFVHNDISGKHLRVDGAVSELIQRFDGKHTVEQLTRETATHPDEQEREAMASCILTLSHFGAIDLGSPIPLVGSTPADKALRARRSWHNPLAIRIPLMNPDVLVGRLQRFTTGAQRRSVLIFMLGIIMCAMVLAVMQWQSIALQVKSVALSPEHWWQLLILYPLLKCLHELAHAVTIKRWGGSVHEAGLTVLVLMPVPYIDATDIWQFHRRGQRIVVCAAGMLAEGVVAAVSLMIWSVVQPGLVSDLAFAAAMLGSLSTLLFNANPLLRFDGYQILQDAVDIPNLASRSSQYLQYLSKRYLLRVDGVRSPVAVRSERRWFVGYGLLALLYRFVIGFGICMYLIKTVPVLGILLAGVAIYQLAIRPVIRLLQYLYGSPELHGMRQRSSLIAISLISVVIIVIFIVPMPNNTRTEGIVWLPDQAHVYVPENGVLSTIHVRSGERIKAGQLLFELSAPTLELEQQALTSRLQAIELEYQSVRVRHPQRRARLKEDLMGKREELSEIDRRLASLHVYAPRDGEIQLPETTIRAGQYLQAGNALAHIVRPEDLIVKTVVRERDITRLQQGVSAVRVRLWEQFDQVLTGTIIGQTPAGNRTLPSKALAYDGFRGIAVAKHEASQWQTIEPVFHVEVALPLTTDSVGIGGRAFVRFSHQAEPVGSRCLRALRQLLLQQFAI